YTRKVNFAGANGVDPRSFTRSYTAHNMLNRLDYQPFSRVHLYSSWQYGYSRTKGQLPTVPDSPSGQSNPIATPEPPTFRPDRGTVAPSNIFNFVEDWTPNSRTVVAARYGYFYYNTEDRGLPSGVRYVYQTDLKVDVTRSPVDNSILVPSGSPNQSFAHD